MATSTFPTVTTGVTVNTATSGALGGDGSSGNKLTVQTDNTTIDVSGSNKLEALGVKADLTMVTGKAIRPDTTTAHTFLIQGYDVDGTAYKTFATMTNSNTPTFNISQPAGGILAILPPSADPHVVGAIWNNAGTLAISAG